MNETAKAILAKIPASALPTEAELRALDPNKRAKISVNAVLVTQEEAARRQAALSAIGAHMMALPSIEQKEALISEVSRLQRAHASKELLAERMSKRAFKIFFIVLNNPNAEGLAYCKLLRDAGITTPPRWREDAAHHCPASYVKAYAMPYWAQRINQEKSQIMKLGIDILDSATS